MSPRFVLKRENVPCIAEVVNKSLKADCKDFTYIHTYIYRLCSHADYKYTKITITVLCVPESTDARPPLLNGLFSHSGRENYPPAALDCVLVVPNLIYMYTSVAVGRVYIAREQTSVFC